MQFDFNTVLALAFACWAGVVGYIGQGIRQDIREIGEDVKEESKKLNQYVVQTEARLARLEEKVK